MGCCGTGRIQKPTPALPALSVDSAKLMARRKIGAVLASDERITKRLQVCRACPHFKEELCFRCGCRLVAKIALESERCPIAKW